MVMECKCGRDLEGDSMRVRGTESGKRLRGKRVGGSTGGTDLGKDSDAIAAMSVDFPVAPSPTTAILTSLRPPALEGPTIVSKRETKKKRPKSSEQTCLNF